MRLVRDTQTISALRQDLEAAQADIGHAPRG